MSDKEVKIFTVSEINNNVKEVLELQFQEYIYVEGEISQANTAQSGHMYLTLKDSISTVRCTLWSARVNRLNTFPELGLQVIVKCRVSFYEKNGSYQLDIIEMKSSSIGRFHELFEKLKIKLKNEGLFDESFKKKLPKYPKKIAVITSLTGSVIEDIIKVAQRRLPYIELDIYGCNVQGENCAKSIINQLITINNLKNSDVIIIARGGGSLEDLIEYNNELLARQIYNSNIPVITAVGHETDTTIVDLVSDIRAATPSEAAEIATQFSMDDILNNIEETKNYINQNISSKIKDIKYYLSNKKNIVDKNNPVNKINSYNQTLDLLSESLSSKISYALNKKKSLVNQLYLKLLEHNPKGKLAITESKIFMTRNKINNSLENILISKRNKLNLKNNTLKDVNPLSILEKGFSLVYCNKKVANRIADFKLRDNLKIRMSDGELYSKVEDLKKY